MEDKLTVVLGENFGIYVGFSCLYMRYSLRENSSKLKDGAIVLFQLTAFLTPKARLINEDFPTPDYEWRRSSSEAAWRGIGVVTTLPMTKIRKLMSQSWSTQVLKHIRYWLRLTEDRP